MIRFKGLPDDLKVSDEVREIGLRAFEKSACPGKSMFYARGYAFKKYHGMGVRDSHFWVLVKEAVIARDLQDKGFNVPKVSGLHYDGTLGRHFMAMRRFVPYEMCHVPRKEKDLAEKKFKEAEEKIKKLGYTPDDCSPYSNCAYTPRGLQPIFFDFEEWQYPARIWNKINDCFEKSDSVELESGLVLTS